MAEIYLVPCASEKRSEPAPAQDLYVSDLFTKCRHYAERRSDRWYILSAKYGLVPPDRVIEPYDQTLNEMRKPERKAWAARVLADILRVASAGDCLTFLAGARYREFLIPELQSRGYRIRVPMKGMVFGKQKQWLKQRIGEA